MSNILNLALEKVKDKLDTGCVDGNVGNSERVLSVVAGGFILGIGIRNIFKSPLTGFSTLTLGGALVWRGVTGKCVVKDTIAKATGEKDVTVIEHRYFVK
ncbi:hypothetical protein HMPREF0765_1113 [Sphingobacterium spiritivorum ATCC 33300]|uniref:Inner membrane protein YgaP-like transmembrane domain-containing protein n=1 Tax=Sphingobacterium spiritivorum ATCC 33300 TaxID=525372 RepID=C2FUV7_SPHSI|nr:DUF2892 domain-containing protein [Sphingobacterium spiritivorum]EEI93311.1 hypothetical protein HMPREF0765_1113 [Sphingobacterium spiritivorum ATCC 33300]QQS96008.1 DUF2892 domain-containing protein [Sphingobacterium spiritivorum]